MVRGTEKEAYVVFKGRKAGLYYTWDECQEQVKGFSGATHQGYTSRHEAERAWNDYEQASRRSPEFGTPASIQGNTHLQSLLNANAMPAKRTRVTEAIENPAPCVDIHEYVLISSDDEEQPRKKKPKMASDFLGDNMDFISFNEVEAELNLENEESPFELTAAQEAVVEMAMNGNNIFLTGAAGSGKTATLKEILRRLRTKYPTKDQKEVGKDSTDATSNAPRVQVVAPTGIAALPLNGKTTYSFAGWNLNSFQQPLKTLLKNTSKRVHKAMRKLEVLIIEEISMVENQFLERLDLLMQHVLENVKPFGGKQVIFLGDFHQLPPVKPFEFCLICGEAMINQKVGPVCNSQKCLRRGVAFKPGDKWAFRTPAWTALRLRHVKLEQIHRQKDAGFQDVLNKIRNGVLLSDDEWNNLTEKKDGGAFGVRLMSRRDQVEYYNKRQLSSIKSEENSWDALDEARQLRSSDEDKFQPRAGQIIRDLETHKESLKDHRLPTRLMLRVGAKVVLLSNINPQGGLVNGSQGEVVRFVDTKEWPVSQPEGKGESRWLAERVKIDEFKSRGSVCPVVRFTNGKTVTIQPIIQESLRGPSYDQYVVSRTQIPLTLAWALSIHKSQGMTLEHVEVSSNDIFESGQLYVGFSRATKIEGLTVTGYSREQLAPDKDVLEFYNNAKWEDLGPSNESKAQIDTTMEFKVAKQFSSVREVIELD